MYAPPPLVFSAPPLLIIIAQSLTDLLLFTTKRANAIKTLLDMTAASASLATTTMTVSRKKNPDSQKFSQVVS